MATKSAFKEKIKNDIREPRRYKVVMYNDDFTPMDFVVGILLKIFHKSEDESIALMYSIHQGDSAVVGVYPYDIARTKSALAESEARKAGYPLSVKVKEGGC